MAELSVNARRNEMAVMRSRGATTGQIMGTVIFEGLILGLVALIIGTGLGLGWSMPVDHIRRSLRFGTPRCKGPSRNNCHVSGGPRRGFSQFL